MTKTKTWTNKIIDYIINEKQDINCDSVDLRDILGTFGVRKKKKETKVNRKR